MNITTTNAGTALSHGTSLFGFFGGGLFGSNAAWGSSAEDLAATASWVKNEFLSKPATFYVTRIPNSNLLIQCGTVGVHYAGEQQHHRVTFPQAFPNACFAVCGGTHTQAVDLINQPAGRQYTGNASVVDISDPTNTGFHFTHTKWNFVGDGRQVYWMAIGY